MYDVERHGRFGIWVYRVRRTWERLFAQFQEPAKSRTGRLVRTLAKVIDWYWPSFNAYDGALQGPTRTRPTFRGGIGRQARHGLRLWHRMPVAAAARSIWRAKEHGQRQPNRRPSGTGMAAAIRQPAAPRPAWTQRARRTWPTIWRRIASGRLHALGNGRHGRHRPLRRAAYLAAGVLRTNGSIASPRRRSALAAADRGDVGRRRHSRAIALQHRLTTLERSPSARVRPERLWEQARPRPT